MATFLAFIFLFFFVTCDFPMTRGPRLSSAPSRTISCLPQKKKNNNQIIDVEANNSLWKLNKANCKTMKISNCGFLAKMISIHDRYNMYYNTYYFYYYYRDLFEIFVFFLLKLKTKMTQIN